MIDTMLDTMLKRYSLAHQNGDLIDQNSITLKDIKMLLQQRIQEIDLKQAKQQDVYHL